LIFDIYKKGAVIMDSCPIERFLEFDNQKQVRSDDYSIVNEENIRKISKSGQKYRRILSLAGINCAGKDTVISFLESSRDDIIRLKLHTSRPPRIGTQKDYPTMREIKDANSIGSDIGNYYFTSREYLEKNMDGSLLFRSKGDYYYALMMEEVVTKIFEARKHRKILLIPGVFITCLILKKELFKNMMIVYLRTPIKHLRERLEDRERLQHRRDILTPQEKIRIDRTIEDAQRYNVLAYVLYPLIINYIVNNEDGRLMDTIFKIESIIDEKL